MPRCWSHGRDLRTTPTPHLRGHAPHSLPRSPQTPGAGTGERGRGLGSGGRTDSARPPAARVRVPAPAPGRASAGGGWPGGGGGMRLLFLAVLRRHTGNAVTAQRVR